MIRDLLAAIFGDFGGWPAGTRAALVKSVFRTHDKQAVMKHYSEAMRRAEEKLMEALAAEGEAILANTYRDPSSFHEDALLYVEKQYVWGFYHEFVSEYPAPTNGYERIKFHIIEFLMKVRKRSFAEARDEANAVEALFNRNDNLFEILSGFGKNAYRGQHSEGRVADAISSLGSGLIDRSRR